VSNNRPIKVDFDGASFGKILKHLREERKMSQSVLADALGTTPQNIGRYEMGKREPSFEFLLKVCDFFNVSTDYMLGRHQNKNVTVENLNDVFGDYNSDFFREQFSKYPLEYEEALLKLVLGVGAVFAELDSPINVDKLFMLNYILAELDSINFITTPITDDISAEEANKSIKTCYSKLHNIHTMLTLFFQRVLTYQDVDKFIFDELIINNIIYGVSEKG
jgi:transcriptional regulator with XRE-family HTH domain